MAQTRFTLHRDPLLANCYKIKLTAALLHIPLEKHNHSILSGDTQTPEFQNKVSFWRRIPVLQVDKSSFLPESNAACFNLAGPISFQTTPFQKAEMLRWMFFEQNHHEVSVASLRFWLHILGEESLSADRIAHIPAKKVAARQCFDYMEDHLANHSQSGWFVGDSITLADICLFAYTHIAAHAGFDLKEWPAVKACCEKVKSVDAFC
ncbi:uncharacterized protein A1O9_04438 [Exophiala aquamarina CBS 119918]|uniref:GST C-terminal domain-containing protein n=1 Tax=Exophiala aquamarina CBS 119918 TaxID=1182545 RepID=A0A072PIL1_9EURO|nr:uncharacterized protein A1O9_04438 [Exophiala aquamarina CBS 119918]KEF59592.1 hypothetical protein A1O9_04438 [Exophiala aquamarina CBS 119918]